MERFAPYRKTVTAVVTGLIGWAAVVITSEPTAITAQPSERLSTPGGAPRNE